MPAPSGSVAAVSKSKRKGKAPPMGSESSSVPEVATPGECYCLSDVIVCLCVFVCLYVGCWFVRLLCLCLVARLISVSNCYLCSASTDSDHDDAAVAMATGETGAKTGIE